MRKASNTGRISGTFSMKGQVNRLSFFFTARTHKNCCFPRHSSAHLPVLTPTLYFYPVHPFHPDHPRFRMEGKNMKKLAIVFILAMLCHGTAFAENFAPSPLAISAQHYLHYNFDGSRVDIPVHVSGTPATVLFLVFTVEKYYKITAVRNGNLGWHYVNKTDTCLYISPPYRFATGDNTFSWNGRDKHGHRIHSDDYTYYLWGYDSSSGPKKVTDRIRFPRFDRSYMHTLDSSGNPLPHPVLYDAPRSVDATGNTPIIRTKWVIGGDPSDASLAETTAYQGWVENSRIALDSNNPQYFFTQSLHPDGNLKMSKWQWTPNGNAILQTTWGENGYISIPTSLDVAQALCTAAR